MKHTLLFFLIGLFGISYCQNINLQNFASGFTMPLNIEHCGDSRLFVLEKTGAIKILNTNGSVNATPFLNISSLVSTTSERGLLGLAFHPNYASNGYFYINYSNTSGHTVIARYSVSSTNPNVANPSSAVILMTINQPYSNHNGGTIKFGSDGYLYIGMGDGGSAGDPNNYAQNLTVDAANPTRVYLGKMLRIDVNTTAGSLNYGYPSSNPFVSQSGKQEIWAYGLRNPWKFSFDKQTGDLWIADVGQNAVEEINKINAPLANTGLNFGWRCYEGNTAYNTTGCAAQSTMVSPLKTVAHSTGACSITGGFVYRGTTYPNMQGKYFFTDYCDDRIGMIDTANNLTYFNNSISANFVSFGEDVNGELYVCDINGTIYKITDTSLNTEEFNTQNFSLYPNPANDEVFIVNKNNISIAKIDVTDIHGKIVLEQNHSFTSVKISNLNSGIYFIRIYETEKRPTIIKIMKK